MKRNLLTMTMFVAVSVFFATSAMATDYYPGTECVLGYSATNNLYYSMNQALSDETYSSNFYCPMYSNSGGFTQMRGGVHVIDTNSTYDVSCSLRTFGISGTSYNYSTKTSTGSSTTPQGLIFDYVSRASGRAYVYMRCSVPGKDGSSRSGIHSYYSTQSY